MRKQNKLLFAVTAGCALVAGCGGQSHEEQISEAQNGPVAITVRDRFESGNLSTDRVIRSFTYEGEQVQPELATRELQLAHSAITNCVAQDYCASIEANAPDVMDLFYEILILTENKLTERGEPFDPEPVSMPDGRRHSERRHEGEGGDIGINFDIDLSETLSEIIDGIAGVANGIGQGVEHVQDSMTCAIELGRRVLPGVLQVLEGEDTQVYACRTRCVQSSASATMAWCFARPGEFTDGGPEAIATLIGAHLLEMCSPIGADDIENFGGCAY